MAKILLVASFKDEPLRIGQYLSPPIGIYRIASRLCKGNCVRVYDPNLDGAEELEKILLSEHFDIIGFSLLYPTLKNDLKNIFLARKASPASLLIAGGQGAVFIADFLLEHSPLDIIVKGFGEEPIEQIALGGDGGTLLERYGGINGLTIRTKPFSCAKLARLELSSPQVNHNTSPVREYTEDDFNTIANSFLFPLVPYETYWSLMESVYSGEHLRMMKNENMLRTVRIMASSHCPMKCAFCSSTNFLDNAVGGRQPVVWQSAENIERQLMAALRSHPTLSAFYFADDDFLINKKRLKELADRVYANNELNKITYFCLGRADRIDHDTLHMLQKANIKFVIFGIESFSDRILADMNKKVRVREGEKARDVLITAVTDTLEHSITPLMNLILFYPTTDVGDIIETIESTLTLIDKGARLTVYTYVEVYPGSEILKQQGLHLTYDEFELEGKTFQLPKLILPTTEEIRRLASESIIRRDQIVADTLEKHNWKGVVPHPLYGLALFQAIYSQLGKDTRGIEQRISKLFEGGENMDGFKNEMEKEFPNIVNVCVLRGACPCECVHCPVGQTPKETRGERFGSKTMDMQLYRKIVDEMALHPNSALRVHSAGEPILWKEIKPALEYAKEKGVKSWIFTSLVTHDMLMLQCLAKSLDIIEVSVNSSNRENYIQTKGIDKFDLVLSNIRYLSDYIKENRLPTRVITSRVESKDKPADEQFVSYWKSSGLVADSFIRSYHSYNGIIEDREGKAVRKPVPCHVHWSRFNIDTDGSAVICFNEIFKGPATEKSMILGDINTESIKAVWHSERLEQIRDAQLSGDYGKVKFTDELPCINCKYCQPLDTTRQTSEHQLKAISK